MDKLYDILDIKQPEDLAYFESIANFFEYGGEIDDEEMYQLIDQVNFQALKEVCSEYFEDLLENIPEYETEVYSLLNNLSLAFQGMMDIEEVTEAPDSTYLVDELNRFRLWYSGDSVVIIRDLEGKSQEFCLRDAMMHIRLAKLENEDLDCDFSQLLDYEIDDYMYNFAYMEDDI